MLKKQGIIKQDPKLPMDKILPPPSPWPKSIFDADEEKSKLLTRLLKSNHPEDLQAANRLIKNLVKEEHEKSEKVSRRISAVEEVRSHVRVLREMLSMYRRPGHALPDQKDVRSCGPPCSSLQATPLMMHWWNFFKQMTFSPRGVLLYKQVVEGRVNAAGNVVPPTVGAIPAPRVFLNPEPCGKNCSLIDLEAPSLLHQDLAALGINDVPTRNQIVIPSSCKDKTKPGAITLLGGGIQSLSADWNLLDLFSPQPSPGPLNYVPQKSIPKEVPPGTKASPGWSWEAGPLASSTASQNTPLAHVFVPLESVKPSSLPPIIVYVRNGFRILLHFSQTGAPGHPDVQVLPLTMMSTATQPVWDVMFQVADPKVNASEAAACI